MKDLYELASITKGNIEYRRSKTGKLFTIAVPQEAESLINKYKGENNFLSFSENYNDHKNFTKTVNKYLKKLASKCEIDKALSTYYARHTWATLAAGLDIPKETISRALGHSRNSITDIYINFDRRKINEANQRVIKLISEKAANSSAVS
jgi:integrase